MLQVIKKLKTPLLVVSVLGGIHWLVGRSVDDYIQNIDKWPNELVATKQYPCNLSNYRTCKEDQWFGVAMSERNLPKSQNVAAQRVLDEVCVHLSDPPNTYFLRNIPQEDGSALVLCRIKEPSKIRRSRLLEMTEKTVLFYELTQ